MAQQFLDTLPKACNLPSDSTCMICLEVYGVKSSKHDTAEIAVLLPCGHHVGAKCISNWLSKKGGNSCPKCRARFFAATPRPYMEHGLINAGEEDLVQRFPPRDIDDYPDLYEATETIRNIARRVDQAGGPSEGQEGRSSSVAGGEWSRNEGDSQRHLWDHFLHRSTQEYSGSLQRARNIESIDARMFRADILESRIESLATSFRLLSFREALLYIHLQNSVARMPRLETPLRGLNAEQEEALFLEIERRGAFDRVHHAYYRYREGSNRERWRLHRERHGQVWSPVERHWY